ncbi:hypothetical protein PLICRDRAFT_117578 [Plicaturopsis crispa FD-325 SS-3]|uniref:CxC1-like cysteine cluster associated with KDZ transposases domain-containing protein n=1 Tax=Plicaturopsis crispa FD-325 SS-3 TaxID=944288 RepID=A0A0C9T5V5_PLICR|nr:hypothetical protein PLICRDRAFT_117578 [Plicaturopsis crispa FD-325 SS-3]
MSFRKPKGNRRSRQSQTDGSSPPPLPPQSSSPFRPVPIEDSSPVKRRAYGTSGRGHPKGKGGLIYLPGRIFTQRTTLPSRNDDRSAETADGVGEDPFIVLANGGDGGNLDGLFGEWDINGRKLAGEKKIKQWAKWEGEVIPELIDPYLRIMQTTQNLRDMPAKPVVVCTCNRDAKWRVLTVMCVDIEKTEIRVCACQPAAVQLLNRGLFPCAPYAPSLAVDLRMLSFIDNLFVRMAPNVMAWCDALESFLDGRGYKLETRNSIRRRFSNSLLWYGSLVNATRNRVASYIEETRTGLMDEATMPTQDSKDKGGEGHRRVHVEEGSQSEYGSRSGDAREETGGAPTGIPRWRPSEYLRSRCPLCFGGQECHDPTTVADVIVCLDACFTQKRRKNKDGRRDPVRTHPDTVFMPEDDVNSMREFVEARRSAGKTGREPTVRSEGEEDGYEGDLKVPNSVLNDCGESFGAADEKREAASTQFFVDTGLMGLLCRHDRVLWLINMTTAGEKQYYALALIKRLFKHLPPSMTVGILYDIGCQLHRSCVKWDFLPDVRDRITFGISVFHAYGHQWACQIVYHPRKCVGFGLTDGEGCERFWSAIKKLIPVLRVSGYHQRLYVLDTQVKYLDDKSLHGLGIWLGRRWLQCQRKKADAELRLADIKASDESLRREWAAQVSEQTKLAPRRSKNKGKIAVEKILALQKSESELKETATALEAQLLGEYDEDVDDGDIAVELSAIRGRIAVLSSNIHSRIRALGANERSNLKRLASNEYVRVRMNARALKKRIRDRLRQRKFELERLERAYRHTVNGKTEIMDVFLGTYGNCIEKNLRSHTASQVKRREPGILSLARAYNKLCEDLASLIRQRKALPGAVAPTPISKDGLFKLDVDDDIWQDIGLEEDDSSGGDIPPWLGDDDVRDGIRARLEVDRCLEEEVRLKRERCTMQEWMIEEWNVLRVARFDADDSNEDLAHQLDLRKAYLCQLCVTWQGAVGGIPCAKDMPESWGPSDNDILKAAVLETTASYDESDSKDDGDYNGFGELDEEEDDAELLEVAEESALADAYA